MSQSYFQRSLNTLEMGLYQSMMGWAVLKFRSVHSFKCLLTTRYCWAWVFKRLSEALQKLNQKFSLGGGRGEGDQLQEGGWRHTLELRMTCDQLWFWHQSIDCHWPLGDSCSAHSAPPPSPKQDPVWGSERRFINWAPPRLCTQWDTVPAPTESILWRGREMDIDDHLKKNHTVLLTRQI